MSNKKRILTWTEGYEGRPGRWRKQVDGEVHYFGYGNGPDDTKAYRAAEKAYFSFREKMEASGPVEIRLQDATITDICERFLQNLQARYELDNVSTSYVEKCRCCLNDFCCYVGRDKRFGCVGELDLDGYRLHTLQQPASLKTLRPISLRFAKDRLTTVKTLYRWAYSLRLIENMPRNMMDYTKYAWPRPKVKVFTTDELKTLWSKATSRTRCWIALALNCGFGQQDISDLRMDELDLTNGCIERKRSKTGVQARYKLWKVTLSLIQENRCPTERGDGRVFETETKFHERGGDSDNAPEPLVRSRIEDGRLQKWDAIRMAFRRLQSKTGINDGRGFYCLRKTGASMIERIDPAATEMYLAHVENGMKRAYAERDWGRLERALKRMWKQLQNVLK